MSKHATVAKDGAGARAHTHTHTTTTQGEPPMTNGPVGVMTWQGDHREAAATPDRRVAVVHPALFNPPPLP